MIQKISINHKPKDWTLICNSRTRLKKLIIDYNSQKVYYYPGIDFPTIYNNSEKEQFEFSIFHKTETQKKMRTRAFKIINKI